MTRKLLLLSLFPSFFCFSQERSEKLSVNAALEYRITPFDYVAQDNSGTPPQHILYSRDNQLSGMSLNVGLEWFVLKNTTIGLINTFRYDNLYYKNDFQINASQTDPVKRMIYDLQFEVKYRFNLRNDDKLLIMGGYGLMNNNTRYYETTAFYDPNSGDIIGYASTDKDFHFSALKAGVGYNYKNFEVLAGLYFIGTNHNFSNYGTSGFGMPFLKLQYNIVKF